MAQYDSQTLFGAIIFTILIVTLIVFVVIKIVQAIYRKFVLSHSKALRELESVNSKYKFREVTNLKMTHSYDNENFYNNVSGYDFLTYQLSFYKTQDKVLDSIRKASENQFKYKLYENEVKDRCKLGEWDTDKLLRNNNYLLKTERKLMNKLLKKPNTDFSIMVTLILTNINDRYLQEKSSVFHSSAIESLIKRINKKSGYFYLDNDVWNSICAVERAKVTNKMRFAIYNRDHNRCRCCGSRNNLEIDHIIPISKGGKTEYNNLQTLCHKCNQRKGDSIY